MKGKLSEKDSDSLPKKGKQSLLDAINFDCNNHSFNYGWWKTLPVIYFPHASVPDTDFHYFML